MFGRNRGDASGSTATEAPAATAEQAARKAAGKGRPTPTRREAEQRNRHPVVGSPRLAPNATKAERKAARTAAREAASAERLKAREAMLSGDERNMPPQHRGPARRWARDYVDARRNLGDYLVPVAFVIIILGFVPQLRTLSLILLPVLYLFFFATLVDAFFVGRRVRAAVTERFGAQASAGVGYYAGARSFQVRRLRVPKPQVARGQRPA